METGREIADGLIDLYKRGIDRTRIRENLALTSEERLRRLQDLQRFVHEVRKSGERARRRRQLKTCEPLLRSLAGRGVEFLLIGDVAALHHGSMRSGCDVEILYRATPANVRRLVRALAPLQPRTRAATPGRADTAAFLRERSVELATDAGPIDCHRRVAGIPAYDVVRRRAVEAHVFDIPCRFLSLDDLIAAMRRSTRLQDLDTAAELETIREQRRHRK